MKRFLFLLLTSGLLPLVSLAQAPVLQWGQRIGNRSRPEYARSIAYARPNRMYVAGNTYAPSGTNWGEEFDAAIWVLNQRGDSIRTLFPFSPISNERIGVSEVKLLPGGDLLLAGNGYDRTQTTPAGQQATSFMFLARADSLANIRWIQRYNYGISVAVEDCVLLPDGGALLLFTQSIGTTPFNQIYYAHAARVDSVGAMRWQHRFSTDFAGLQHAVACPDGSYALAGAYGRRAPQNRLIYNAWILYLTADGDTIRSRHWNSLNDVRNISDLKLTPDGGLLLGGYHVNGPAVAPGTVANGWLHKLDAQGNTQWDYDIVASNPSGSTSGADIRWLQVLQSGDFLVYGSRNQAPTPNYTMGYLARWHPPGSGSSQPRPAWELQLAGDYSTPYYAAMATDGSLTLTNTWDDPNPPQYPHIWLRHYASQGLPYEPQAALCATPPVPNAAYAIPAAAPDSLTLVELGSPGPQYAQLVRWRWTLGDGTVVNQTSPAPVRHRYAAVPPFGTPVTVTITNNLGCTATQTLYPWGTPTATQPARALAARTTLFPNPAPGATATLRLTGLRPQGPVPGQLLDALGRELRRFTLPTRADTADTTLDLSGLPPGVYTLRLLPAEGPVSKRLVRH